MTMNSLSLGVWGSFSTPRSRALGGKSGMTRAAPLVLFILARRADFRLPHLLALAGLALFIAWTATPPPDRPHLMTFIQEQPCQDDPTVVFTDPVTRDTQSEACLLPAHAVCRGTRQRACAGAG
ncbi:hypothetical protein [Stutzerimonas nitrititolerans]|uniref:hypothetical protein n=1 Tax=Stutzerimonas nitrititolerans TaxID=2482751 RepID=UPI0028B0DC65|nr:hypothetical protein [Stutzerimonas nitrititolerans]